MVTTAHWPARIALTDALRELLCKYDLLLALCAGEPGRTVERRDAMRAIAARFPAALREWEEILPEELARRRAQVAARLAACEASTDDPGAPADPLHAAEPWLRFGLDLHRYLRTVLALRRHVGSARRAQRSEASDRAGALLTAALARAQRQGIGTTAELPWPEPLTEALLRHVAAPPAGRLTELAYHAVATRHGAQISDVKRALFSAHIAEQPGHPTLHTMSRCDAQPAQTGRSGRSDLAAPAYAPPPSPPAHEPASVTLETELLRRRAVAVESILELIGRTPLIRLRNLEPDGVEIWAKCEFCNPGGSVKDRPALQMIRDAIADGRLTPDKTIIDATSGNTGVAYSLVGAALGYRVKLVMPENVSAARKQITSAYGTEIVFSSDMEGSDGAIRMVRELVAREPDRYFYPDQYSNESNPRAHYLGTGPEILALLGDRITHFVAGLGTSGTVMGTGRRMKEHRRPDGGTVTVVAVEPDDAFHGLEGLKHMASSLVPQIFRPEECVDRTIEMPTEEGWDATERLKEAEGLFVGHSAGANVAAAVRIARELAARGQTGCIVTVLCDRGDRYFVPLKWERRYEY